MVSIDTRRQLERHGVNCEGAETHFPKSAEPMPILGPRVAIIGNADGEKSTLARKIGQALDIPVTHVDSVQYQSGWQRTDTAECDRILRPPQGRQVG